MINTQLYLERCKSLGLKQSVVARRLGIHRASLYRKVRNKEAINGEQILDMCDILQLDTPMGILLCRECLPTGDRKESDGR